VVPNSGCIFQLVKAIGSLDCEDKVISKLHALCPNEVGSRGVFIVPPAQIYVFGSPGPTAKAEFKSQCAFKHPSAGGDLHEPRQKSIEDNRLP
jgi:hypothetical protein